MRKYTLMWDTWGHAIVPKSILHLYQSLASFRLRNRQELNLKIISSYINHVFSFSRCRASSYICIRLIYSMSIVSEGQMFYACPSTLVVLFEHFFTFSFIVSFFNSNAISYISNLFISKKKTWTWSKIISYDDSTCKCILFSKIHL